MTEELELPIVSAIVAAYPKEDRDKTVVIQFALKPGNRVYNGKRIQGKGFGGVFTSMDSEGKSIDRCFYDMVDGTPGVPFNIDDKLALDLRNNVHFANFMMFKERLALYPDSAEGITIIDQVNTNKLNISNEEKLLMIKSKIVQIKKDEKALKTMYRRLFGDTTGLTTETIYGKLFEKANLDPNKVVEYFESIGGEDESFRMLLDLAKEKRIVTQKDGFHIIVATNVILGSSYETAIIRLRDDKDIFADLQQLINNVDRVPEKADFVKNREISMASDIWDLEKTVKEAVINSKSEDAFHLELNDATAMDDFIKNLVKNKILSQAQNKKYSSEFLPIDEITKTQLIDLFKNNNGLIVQAKNYLR